MTMCNVWLAVDYETAVAYASTAIKVPTDVGTAVLFHDGSAGYMTIGAGWRQLLTRSRRDDMVDCLWAKIERMERNLFTRLLTVYRRTDLLIQIRLLERAL